MKTASILLAALGSAVFLNGCKTVRAEGPQIPVPAAKPRLDEAKNNLKNKRKTVDRSKKTRYNMHN